MKFSYKRIAAAVVTALGLAGSASAQDTSGTFLNVIAWDPTTNNYDAFQTTLAFLTAAATTGSGNIALSGETGWTAYATLEGAAGLANTKFIVWGANLNTANANGFNDTELGYSGIPPTSWAQGNISSMASDLTLAVGQSNFATAGFGTAAGWIGANGDFGGLAGGSMQTNGGSADNIIFWAAANVNTATGVNGTPSPILETVTLNATAGTLSASPVSSVPEPGTFALMGAGLLAVGAMVRRRTRG